MKTAVEKRKALEEELKELNARKARFSADTPSSSVPVQAAAWSYNGIPLTFESTRVSEEVFRFQCHKRRCPANFRKSVFRFREAGMFPSSAGLYCGCLSG